MLGLTFRFDSYKDRADQVIHVLEVERNSPADKAALLSNVDYLLGTARRVSFSFFVLIIITLLSLLCIIEF